MAGEILWEDGEGGDGETACPKAEAECLREEDVPVGRGQADKHEPRRNEECAGDEKGAEVTGIEQGTADEADKGEKEGLDGS